jgi:hypothetical protein
MRTLIAFFLFLSLFGCSQNLREYLIEGTIIEINEKTGEMVIEGTLIVKKSPNNPWNWNQRNITSLYLIQKNMN